jgi:hypothetical protein
VGSGVNPPASVPDWLDEELFAGGCVVGCRVGFGFGFGLAAWVVGIFAIAYEPSGLALAWSKDPLPDDGTRARVAAARGLAGMEDSGDGTAPTATATPRPATAAATPAPAASRPRFGLGCR